MDTRLLIENSASSNLDYLTYSEMWTKCRDAYIGQSVVHDKTTLYLPALANEKNGDVVNDFYLARLKRSIFLGAMSRTVDAHVGALFKKSMIKKVPDTMLPWLKNVTGSGTSFTQFSTELAEEVIKVGRYGVLVDYPLVNTEGMTKFEYDSLKIVPYFVCYLAEQIVDWYEKPVNGYNKLVMVRLRELFVDDTDVLKRTTRTRTRILLLENGVYKQRIYENDSCDGEYSELTPQIDGKTLDYIPFVFFNSQNNSPDITKPILADMVDIVFDWYQTNSSYKHGMYYCALPTPYITGISETEKTKISIGPSQFLALENPDSECGYMQANPSFLADFRSELERLQNNMAVLGSRVMIPDRTQSETAEALNIKSVGEQSALSRVADAMSSGLTKLLNIVNDFLMLGDNDDIYVNINKTFTVFGTDPQIIAEAFKAQQAGLMSRETYFKILQEKNVIGSETSFEEEERKIQEDDYSILNEVGQENI